MTVPDKLYQVQLQDAELKVLNRFIKYSDIADISHCNFRHIINGCPDYETFCVSIKSKNGKRIVLFKQIKLKKYVGGRNLKEAVNIGFNLPKDVELQIMNLRYEHLSLLEILRERSSVEPRKRGFFFASAMEIYAFFANEA